MNDRDADATEPAPDWVWGVWRRNTLRCAGGVVDDTAQVFWVQTPTLFADIRIPDSRSELLGQAGNTSLADYDNDALLQLSHQEGFAGSLSVHGQICHWRRPIDFQPTRLAEDEGAMFRDGDRLTETGIHANYLEDYSLIDDGGGRFLALDCPEHRRLLVIVGNRFLFARGRTLELPKGVTLNYLVSQAEPEQKSALLDCELSLGHGLGDGLESDAAWRIDLSTLPFREGQSLLAGSSWRFDLEDRSAVETTSSETAGQGKRMWKIHTCTLDQHALSQLFPSN